MPAPGVFQQTANRELTVWRIDSRRAMPTAAEAAELFDHLRTIERGALVDLTRLVAEQR